MKIDSYSICKPVKGICKQWAIWANCGSQTFPLVYLQRPKYVTSDSAWESLMESVRLDISVKDLLEVISEEQADE